MYPLKIPYHHEALGDPTLLVWIKDIMDQVIGLDPFTLVVIFGAVMLGIPVAILTAYAFQRRHN